MSDEYTPTTDEVRFAWADRVGKQPGECGHTEHAVRGDGRYGRHFETADPAGEWARCPAPEAPASEWEEVPRD